MCKCESEEPLAVRQIIECVEDQDAKVRQLAVSVLGKRAPFRDGHAQRTAARTPHVVGKRRLRELVGVSCLVSFPSSFALGPQRLQTTSHF